jgi:hypothetical protein
VADVLRQYESLRHDSKPSDSETAVTMAGPRLDVPAGTDGRRRPKGARSGGPVRRLLLNHFSIMQTVGIERADALKVLALYAGVQVVVTLSTGALLDRYEPRRLVPLVMFLLAATSALPALGSGIAVSWLYALCLGGA